MPRVNLIHGNVAAAAEHVARLRAAGYEVAHEPLSRDLLQQLRSDPPAAILIDLGRAPTQGRDIALALRTYKNLRSVPLVILEGDPEFVGRLRALLPDAVHTTWRRIRSALEGAIAHPPSNPVVPSSRLAGYSGRPVAKKLGIKAGMVVALAGAPVAFEDSLGTLPDGTVVHREASAARDLTIWFPETRRVLEENISRMGAFTEMGGLWIAWAKMGSAVATDLTSGVVSEVGLGAGLVDYKIIAIDDTWSGRLFTCRRRPAWQ